MSTYPENGSGNQGRDSGPWNFTCREQAERTLALRLQNHQDEETVIQRETRRFQSINLRRKERGIEGPGLHSHRSPSDTI